MGKIHTANGGYWVGRDPQSQLYRGHRHPCEGTNPPPCGLAWESLLCPLDLHKHERYLGPVCTSSPELQPPFRSEDRDLCKTKTWKPPCFLSELHQPLKATGLCVPCVESSRSRAPQSWIEQQQPEQLGLSETTQQCRGWNSSRQLRSGRAQGIAWISTTPCRHLLSQAGLELRSELGQVNQRAPLGSRARRVQNGCGKAGQRPQPRAVLGRLRCRESNPPESAG